MTSPNTKVDPPLVGGQLGRLGGTLESPALPATGPGRSDMDPSIDSSNSRTESLQNHGQKTVSNSASGAQSIADGDNESAGKFSKTGQMNVPGSEGRVGGANSGLGKGSGGPGGTPLGAFASNMPVPGMAKAPMDAFSSFGQPLQGALGSVQQLPQQVFSPLASLLGGGGGGMPGGLGGFPGGSMSPMAAVGSVGGGGGGGGPLSGDLQSRLDQFVSQTAGKVEYAWGGGHDPNRPGMSQGVHDYGVADSFGDYKKQGVDCSGFTRWAYSAVTGNDVLGASTSQSQYSSGSSVSAPRSMDLAFPPSAFSGNGGPHHVQLYVGNGMIAEAPESGQTVRVRPVTPGTVFRRFLSEAA